MVTLPATETHKRHCGLVERCGRIPHEDFRPDLQPTRTHHSGRADLSAPTERRKLG